jgi:hypothetical protein
LHEKYLQIKHNILTVGTKHKDIERKYYQGLKEIEHIFGGQADYFVNGDKPTDSSKNSDACNVTASSEFGLEAIENYCARNLNSIREYPYYNDAINYPLILDSLNSKVKNFGQLISNTQQKVATSKNDKDWILDALLYNKDQLKTLRATITEKSNQLSQ